MKIVILTGAELRHSFLRKSIALDPAITVLRSYCEGAEKGLTHKFGKPGDDVGGEGDLRHSHIAARAASEQEFFAEFVEQSEDLSAPFNLPKGEVNQPGYTDEINDLAPDLLAAYGCSLIRDPLMSAYAGRFLNVHLGLSPWYRGSGTNFWPLVEGRPECVGATFMHLDAGIDTGEIIHQIRARILPGDTPHQIGNRLIEDIAAVYPRVIAGFNSLPALPALPVPDNVRVCRQQDYSEASVVELHRRFNDGLVDNFLADRAARCAAVPILENPALA